MLTLPLLLKRFPFHQKYEKEGMSNKKKNAPIVERDLMVFPPAIPFHPKPKKKADDEKEDETKTVTFKVTLGRGEDETNAQKTEWSFRVFEDGGDAEDYVKEWRIRFEELAEAMHLDTPDKKYTVLQQALRGEARARFNTAWHSVEIPTNVSPGRFQVMSEKRLNKGYNALAKQLFVPVDSAWRRQRSYLRYHVKFGNMTVAEFRRRLIEQNEFLKYFPAPAGKSVSKLMEEELLVEIVDRAKPVEYHCDVLANIYDPYHKTLQEYTEYLERLEVKHNIQPSVGCVVHVRSTTTGVFLLDESSCLRLLVHTVLLVPVFCQSWAWYLLFQHQDCHRPRQRKDCLFHAFDRNKHSTH